VLFAGAVEERIRSDGRASFGCIWHGSCDNRPSLLWTQLFPHELRHIHHLIEELLKEVIRIIGPEPLPGLEVQHVLKHERDFEVLWKVGYKCVDEVI
jgi:hypothetical protein